MAGKIWFGTAERFTQVNCPAYNARTSHEGWDSSGTFLNGGAYVKSSPTAHMVYEFDWNLAAHEDIRAIVDYASKVYGEGPVYFYLPGVMNTNALPEYWASPVLGLRGEAWLKGATNTEMDTPTAFRSTHDLPLKGVRSVVTSATTLGSFPVPAGMTAILTVWGRRVSGTGALTLAGATVNLTTTNARVRATVLGTTGTTMMAVSFGAGTFEIFGLVLQVIPTAQVNLIVDGAWVSGRGHSGCRFESRPSVNTYSAALDKYGASARLIEAGAWE